MDKILFGTALILGAVSVLWMGFVFVDTSALAFSVVAVIGGVYSMGVVELVKFRSATSTLSNALYEKKEDIPSLGTWLEKLDLSIRNGVRLRIEGERAGLPEPVMTPYLVGLLVMLGILGTFVGLVDTLSGAVNALQGTTELQAVRDGLTAPIKGLGLAFGTSVAGVATSAMLGLMSTLCRRARILETQRLDSLIPTYFRAFSVAYRQRETFKALQVQTRVLPEVAAKLDALVTSLSCLGGTLIDNQEKFHVSVKENYTKLAASVDQSLREHLDENVHHVGETIEPIVQAAMSGLGKEAQEVHRRFVQTSSDNIEEATSSWIVGQETADKKRLALWTSSLEQAQKKVVCHLSEASDTFIGELKQVTDMQGASVNGLKKEFISITSDMAGQWQKSGEEIQAGQQETLESLKPVIHQMTMDLQVTQSTLTDTVAQIRKEASNRIERDNYLLEENSRIIGVLDELTVSMSKRVVEQSEGVEQLVEMSGKMLEKSGRRFARQVDEKGTHLTNVADAFAGSAAEMASLGDAFRTAVDLFNQSNKVFVEKLSRIEVALDAVAVRSDDQLGYYVAQAREIVDLCMVSQKEMFSALSQFHPTEHHDLEAD